MLTSNTGAAETNVNPLLEGIEIVGPDYIYETQKNVKFYISKAYGDAANQDDYSIFNYCWRSADIKTAKFNHRTQSKKDMVKYPKINYSLLSGVKNGKVKKIRVYVGNKGKTITKKKRFTMKKKKKYRIFVELTNKKTGQTYSYECNIRKYKSKKKN